MWKGRVCCLKNVIQRCTQKYNLPDFQFLDILHHLIILIFDVSYCIYQLLISYIYQWMNSSFEAQLTLMVRQAEEI